MEMLRLKDPEATEQRRKRRLKKRIYRCKVGMSSKVNSVIDCYNIK